MEQIQKQFIVRRDGQVDQELMRIVKPSPLQEIKKRTILQIEMAWYDLLHGTSYRRVRNQLVREKQNRAFEARLGLVRK